MFVELLLAFLCISVLAHLNFYRNGSDLKISDLSVGKVYGVRNFLKNSAIFPTAIKRSLYAGNQEVIISSNFGREDAESENFYFFNQYSDLKIQSCALYITAMLKHLAKCKSSNWSPMIEIRENRRKRNLFHWYIYTPLKEYYDEIYYESQFSRSGIGNFRLNGDMFTLPMKKPANVPSALWTMAKIYQNMLFQSVVSGDSSKRSESIVKDAPPYDPDDFPAFYKKFLIFLPENLNELLDGTESLVTSPDPDDYDNSVASEVTRLAKDVKKFNKSRKRNKLLYQAVYSSVSKSATKAGITLVDTAPMFDGVAAWKTLIDHHNDPSQQNKLLSVQTLLNLRQLPNEAILDFKVRLEKAFARIRTLKVSWDDLVAVKFMLGLDDKYSRLIDTLSISGDNITVEDVYREALSFDQRKSLREEDHAVANTARTISEDGNKPPKIASSQSTGEIFSKNDIKAIKSYLKSVKEEKANAANATHSKYGGNSSNNHYGKGNNNKSQSGNGGGKTKLDHNIDECPNGPTEYERTLTCSICEKKGHAKRTCRKRDRGDDAIDKKSSAKKNRKENVHFAREEVCFMAIDNLILPSSTNTSNFIEMYADSGASRHMVSSDVTLENTRSDIRTITTASGQTKSTHSGDFGSLKNVLSVPGLTKGLFSIPVACSTGKIAIFDEFGFKLYDKNDIEIKSASKPVLDGSLDSGSYILKIPKQCIYKGEQETALVADAYPENKYTLWHQRLCHSSANIIRTMKNLNTVKGITFQKNDITKHKSACVCAGCAQGKMTLRPVRRLPAKSDSFATPAPGRLVCADLLVSPIVSNGGNTCALVIVDVDTKYYWVYTMKSKDEALLKFQDWLNWMTKKNIKIQSFTTLRTDNGGEFVGVDFSNLLKNQNITHEFSPPYMHVYLAERAIRSLQDAARSSLYGASVNVKFWAEALACACYTLNRLPDKSDLSKSRYERFFGEKPDMSNIRTFWCVVWSKIYDEVRKKWSPQAYKGIFIGYDDTHPKTWKIWNTETKKVVYTYSAVFDETMNSNPQLSETQLAALNLELSSIFDSVIDPSNLRSHTISPAHVVPEVNVTTSEQQPVRRSARIAANYAFIDPELAFSSALENRILHAAELKTPTSQKSASMSPEADFWHEAEAKEVESLAKNDTFIIEERMSNMRVLGCKWIYKIKENLDGTVARFKVRITALGNLQRSGFDYQETFAPVVRYSTVRVLMAVAAARNLLLHQMDVDTAFLYGKMPISNPIYVTVPKGYPIPQHLEGKELVARCNKSIYGLKQSPRLWNENLQNTMRKFGFTKSEYDECLFVKRSNGEELYVAIFVDDLIIAGSSLTYINDFKNLLKKEYSMKDIGELKYFLGMEVIRDYTKGTITLSQHKYCMDVLRRFGMLNCNPSPIPIDPKVKLSVSMAPKTPEEIKKSEKFEYREIIGSCMYLMVSTRPDISFAVSKLAQFLNCHGPSHHTAAIQLLRYLKGTSKMGITYGLDKTPLKLTGYSDADWASNIDSRRSTTGYVFFLSGGAISWKSKNQPTVALSSTEAEYMALTSSAQEAMALQNILSDFNIDISAPVLIYEDNQGAIAMSINPVLHQTSKHIHIKHHFIREKVNDGNIVVNYISTEKMLADMFTKALSKIILYKLRDQVLGLVSFGENF
jgi:hypothetical protein